MAMTLRGLARSARNLAFVFGLVATCTFPTQAQPANTPVPLENFFQNPSISEVRLSPDGTHLALLVALKGGRVQLAVAPIGAAPKIIAGFSDADISRFEWVSNERLVMSTTDLRTASGERSTPGLFAINRDGSKHKTLVSRIGLQTRQLGALSWHHALHSAAPTKFPNEVYVAEFEPERPFRPRRLLRQDTLTGRSEEVGMFGPHSRSWVLGHDGIPRITTTVEKGLQSIHYNDPATQEWRKIGEFQQFAPESFTPRGFGPDGTLYVSSRIAGDKQAIHAFDLVHNTVLPQPVAALNDYDFRGSFVYGDSGVLGLRFLGRAPGTHWIDARMKAIQQAVNELLPTTVNTLVLAADRKAPHLVVVSGSDVEPRSFYLYNTQTQRLLLIGKYLQGIDPDRMATTEMLRYKARDGLEIPAYLTLPPGPTDKNLPLVVLVHGGPYVRGGTWMWESERQFLASRGYAVLEPEFRGSTGFGAKHFRAGWKQWGLAMQDDLADGVRWLIDKGTVDAKRICIAGASYGGYATLMGLVNDPDLYRCGVQWVGVTDIGLMYTLTTSDATEEAKQYGMPILLGDLERDAEQLKKTSPLAQAARITQPLLMAYGALDRRVPIAHGEKLREALRPHNPQVEWVSYPNEGHGWSLVSNRIDFWSRVEAFLERHIGAKRSD